MKAAGEVVRSFLVAEDATAATEYAIILGLIVLAAVGAISGLGGTVSSTFAALDTGLGVG